MRKSPEYIALEKIKDMSCKLSNREYIGKVDSIACDATMNYEFVQDDLLRALERFLIAAKGTMNPTQANNFSGVFIEAETAIAKAKGELR